MPISIIVAMAQNGVIGKNNSLPWRLPEDLRYFKRRTLGKCIIMGRKTYDSIGRPLPGRTNVVVTRQKTWRAEGVHTVNDFDTALILAESIALPVANKAFTTGSARGSCDSSENSENRNRESSEHAIRNVPKENPPVGSREMKSPREIRPREIMVIGGAQLYREALPRAERLYITQIHGHFEGDAFFPDLDPSQWRETEREDFRSGGPVPGGFSFLVLDRVTGNMRG